MLSILSVLQTSTAPFMEILLEATVLPVRKKEYTGDDYPLVLWIALPSLISQYGNFPEVCSTQPLEIEL